MLCARRGALLRPQEIALAAGDTAAELLPSLTVYFGSAGVNPLTAVPPLHSALALPEPSATQAPQPGQAYTVAPSIGDGGGAPPLRAVIRYTGAAPAGC